MEINVKAAMAYGKRLALKTSITFDEADCRMRRQNRQVGFIAIALSEMIKFRNNS